MLLVALIAIDCRTGGSVDREKFAIGMVEPVVERSFLGYTSLVTYVGISRWENMHMCCV